MRNPQPGQVVRVIETATEGGEWRLTVEAVTPSGSVLGHLMVPPNGAEGAVVFVPDPDLTAEYQGGGLEVSPAHETVQPPPDDWGAAALEAGPIPPARPAPPPPPPGAALTTSTVPVVGGGGPGAADSPNPDDPRGIKRGRR